MTPIGTVIKARECEFQHNSKSSRFTVRDILELPSTTHKNENGLTTIHRKTADQNSNIDHKKIVSNGTNVYHGIESSDYYFSSSLTPSDVENVAHPPYTLTTLGRGSQTDAFTYLPPHRYCQNQQGTQRTVLGAQDVINKYGYPTDFKATVSQEFLDVGDPWYRVAPANDTVINAVESAYECSPLPAAACSNSSPVNSLGTEQHYTTTGEHIFVEEKYQDQHRRLSYTTHSSHSSSSRLPELIESSLGMQKDSSHCSLSDADKMTNLGIASDGKLSCYHQTDEGSQEQCLDHVEHNGNDCVAESKKLTVTNDEWIYSEEEEKEAASKGNR